MLVVLLVAVPVGGMTVLSVVTRSANHADSWAPVVYGARADIYATTSLTDDFDFDRFVPEGSTTAELVEGWAVVETEDATVDVGAQLYGGTGFGDHSFAELEGRFPRAGEVWLSIDLAEELGVAIGDTLALRHPEGTWAVVGVGRTESGSSERVIVMPDLPLDQFRPSVLHRTTLVDLPDDTTPIELRFIGESIRNELDSDADEFFGWASWDERDHRDDGIAPLAWTWVVGTLALAAMGIVIAAAFATSARRQLVTIGVLSSNGSSERSTRRMLALQGAWTGLAGSVLGVGLGLIALFAFRSFLEDREGRALGDYQFAWPYLVGIVATGTVAATLAALLPARSASKVPVMAALAGRRPLGSVPPRLVPRGIGLSVVGALLLVMGAVSRDGGAVPTIAAAIGGLFVMVGMCFCSPLAVDWMGRASGRLTGAWRLAGRSLGRTRTRSAAVVTAIAVISALTVAGAASAHVVADDHHVRQIPTDAVGLVPNRGSPRISVDEVDFTSLQDHPLDAETVAAIDAIVPSAVWHDRRVASWDPAPFGIGVDGTWDRYDADVNLAIADEAMMDLYELTDGERAALRDVGVLAVSSQFAWLYPAAGVPTERRLEILTEAGPVELEYARREFLDPVSAFDETSDDVMYGIDPFLITEEAARDAGFDIVTSGGFLRSDSPLTSEQRDAVQNATYGYGSLYLGQYYRDLPLPVGESEWNAYVDWRGYGLTARSMQGILVAIAFVLTLLVVAIGLALAAAEGVNERDVLVAVGGRPGTMRSMAGARATVLTFTGVALAVPFGLLPTYAVMRATDHRLEVPWLVIGALLVVVPVVAGGITWLVSAIGQRVRPVRLSNLAFD